MCECRAPKLRDMALGSIFFVLLVVGVTESDREAAQVASNQLELCRAVVHEMHVEIHKHNLRDDAKGEDDIFETVPAICLSVVQRYTFTRAHDGDVDEKSWTFAPIPKSQSEAQQPDVQALLLTKHACEVFVDEWQQEISEHMYRYVLNQSDEYIAERLCEDRIRIGKPTPTPTPAPARQSTLSPQEPELKPTPERQPHHHPGSPASPGGSSAGIDSSSFDTLLAKYDTDGSLASLLEQERTEPERNLPQSHQAEVRAASRQHSLRCDVCAVATRQAYWGARHARHYASDGALERRHGSLRDEEALVARASALCVGQLLDEGQMPRQPGNPPEWASGYSVVQAEVQGQNQTQAEARGESHPPATSNVGSDVISWRLERARPKDIGEVSGARFAHNRVFDSHAQRTADSTASQAAHDAQIREVKRNTIVSRACKALFSEKEAVDLAETIYSQYAAAIKVQSKTKPEARLDMNRVAQTITQTFCADCCQCIPEQLKLGLTVDADFHGGNIAYHSKGKKRKRKSAKKSRKKKAHGLKGKRRGIRRRRKPRKKKRTTTVQNKQKHGDDSAAEGEL